jgi:hypothetical protein
MAANNAVESKGRKTIYDTYAENCSVCGASEGAWDHNPVIGGSAHNHKFVASRSVMESLTAIGAGRPFVKCELSDLEYYALRYYAIRGLFFEAQEHPECGKVGCDVCTMREYVTREVERERARDAEAREHRAKIASGEIVEVCDRG